MAEDDTSPLYAAVGDGKYDADVWVLSEGDSTLLARLENAFWTPYQTPMMGNQYRDLPWKAWQLYTRHLEHRDVDDDRIYTSEFVVVNPTLVPDGRYPTAFVGVLHENGGYAPGEEVTRERNEDWPFKPPSRLTGMRYVLVGLTT